MDELRLHAMGLSAGLSTTVPDPVGNDGTETMYDSDEYVPSVNSYIENALTFLVPYWTLENFWPWLHIETEEPPEADFDSNIHISVDILKNFRIHTLSAASSAEQTRTPEQIDEDGKKFVDFLMEFIVKFFAHAALVFAIGLAIRAIDSCSTLILNPGTLAILIVMLIAWLVLIGSYLAWLDYAVCKEILHPWAAAVSILFLLAGIFTGTLWTSLKNFWPLLKHFNKWMDIEGTGISGLYPKDWYALGYNIVSMAFKIGVLLTLLEWCSKFYQMGFEL